MPEAFIDRGVGGDQALSTARWARQDDISGRSVVWNDLFGYPDTVPGLLLGEFPVPETPDTCKVIEPGGRAQEYSFRVGDAAALFWNDDRHVVTIAGSRAEKGVALIIPNVALYAGSILVNDPKGEVATLTAERRGQGSDLIRGLGQKVAVLDPYRVALVPDAYRSGFNPLDALGPDNPHTVADAGLLADAFAYGGETDGSSRHFEERARSLVEGLILHCISSEPPERRTLLTVYEYLTLGVRQERPEKATGTAPHPFIVLRQLMRNNTAYGGLVEAAERMLGMMGENERGSVISTAERMLSFLKYDGPREMFSRSMPFPLETLKADPQGCTIYMCLPVTALNTHAGIMRMLIQQSIKMMERTAVATGTGHPVLFVLDEFGSLRHLQVLEDASPYMAGFGAKLWAIVQDIGQLRSLYRERWETFLSNAGVIMAWGNADYSTQEYLSKRLGQAEVRRLTRGISSGESTSEGGTHGFSMGGRFPGSGDEASRRRSQRNGENYGDSASISETAGESTSEQIQRGALLTTDEVARLFSRESGRMLVLINGALPLVLDRVRYYDRFEFMGKIAPDVRFPRAMTPWEFVQRTRAEQYRSLLSEQLEEVDRDIADLQKERDRLRWYRVVTTHLGDTTNGLVLGTLGWVMFASFLHAKADFSRWAAAVAAGVIVLLLLYAWTRATTRRDAMVETQLLKEMNVRGGFDSSLLAPKRGVWRSIPGKLWLGTLMLIDLSNIAIGQSGGWLFGIACAAGIFLWWLQRRRWRVKERRDAAYYGAVSGLLREQAETRMRLASFNDA